MAKKRLILIVGGDVQLVGFRREVESIARELGVVGVIKNLRDGTVKIIGEAEEDILKEFERRVLSIKREEDLERFIPRIQVSFISEEWGKATGEYKGFKRVYDEETISPEEQNEERWDKAFLIVGSLAKELGRIPSAISGLRDEVGSRFDLLDMKYSSISILACATVVSLTIVSIWGAMVISGIIERSPSSFASLAIPYILLWMFVSILVIRNRLQIKKTLGRLKEQQRQASKIP